MRKKNGSFLVIYGVKREEQSFILSHTFLIVWQFSPILSMKEFLVSTALGVEIYTQMSHSRVKAVFDKEFYFRF
jgi:hypothetical protein